MASLSARLRHGFRPVNALVNAMVSRYNWYAESQTTVGKA
jgi:hypothetical protein